ncbi:hypothetical protein IE4872_CH03251 [Rhizobium gallicum]|uniref:DUF5132 domain-containing protein n=1 Tax=Rhizobium gallicum TaxID=56730 RepID=A0A1L5NLR9_9HYPH|nr:DUF5132 domain-containing protein [Rhizobium gallicum]APO68851.1 hypothetical protein IE4872_CH03251 [Rhizobium gallicum]
MAILEDALKGGNVVTGLAIGVGAIVLAPLAAPLLRPITRTVLKAGLVAYDQTRVAVAEMNERATDLVAEARAEMAETGAESRPSEKKTTRASAS